MQLHYAWWILALVLGALEIVSGTFYLLVLAAGCAAGGIAAWTGASLTIQVLATAAVTIAGWAWLFRSSPWRQTSAATGAPGMLLDVGEVLEVGDWRESRSTRVRYRGAEWAIELDAGQPGSAATPGRFVIDRVVGNRLIVRRADPGA